MNELQNLKCSGATTVAGGAYDHVRASGALKVTGTLDCQTMHVSGAAKIVGSLTCGAELHSSGSVKLEGELQVGNTRLSGSTHVAGKTVCSGELRNSGSFFSGGDIQTDSLNCSGKLQCDGVVHAREIHTCGKLTACGVEAEVFRSTGRLTINGLLNAEDIEIAVASNNEIGDIGGSHIVVHREQRLLCVDAHPRLTVKSIEGDNIALECTKAEVVRGRFVRIGGECEIGRVEYTEDISVEGGTVQEQRKV